MFLRDGDGLIDIEGHQFAVENDAHITCSAGEQLMQGILVVQTPYHLADLALKPSLILFECAWAVVRHR